MEIILIGIQELHLFKFDVGKFNSFPGIKRTVNNGAGAQVLELDLNGGLLRRSSLIKLNTTEQIAADLNRHACLNIINWNSHRKNSIPAPPSLFKLGRRARLRRTGLTAFFKLGRMGTMLIKVLVIITGSYLLGSLPFGYLIAKLKKVDIRKHGSGNIGATNVFRTLGPVAGLAVFLLDLLKGTVSILLAQHLTQNPWLIVLAAAAAVLGHTFPVFLKFKGGRGAATGLGVLLGVAPDIFLAAFIIVALIIWITRYVSLASIITPVLVTLAFFLLNRPLPYSLVAALVTILIIIRHIPNIKRLLAGTESKIGAPSAGPRKE